jgi:glycosyltransferase involved in cell wall biosynthesis
MYGCTRMDSQQNKFVIVTPSYNNENWVETYFDSVICQTYTNYKVIYINDASTDNTDNEITSRIKGNDKFVYVKNTVNKGAAKNYTDSFDQYCEDDDIILNLDGDDWFATPNVLGKLNDAYIKYDYWMTYGKMVVYTENGITDANPQNTPYNQFVHTHQFYRRDSWRASHLRTFKKFLFKMIDKRDHVSKIDGKLYWHGHDLSIMYPMMEMTPIEKIGVIQFPTYVYNASNTNALRTKEREKSDNNRYEMEIRNKKPYIRVGSREQLKYGVKLPQINVIGDYKERNSIPTRCSFVYNQTEGDFDITMVQDTDILKIISGEIKIKRGKIIADVHEPPYLFNQSEVYQKVYKNSKMFDVILTNNEELLTLPNAIFRNSGYEVVLNKNVHKQTYPVLQDNSLMKIYDKTKMISFITSNKTFTPGHIFRLKCLNNVVANKCPLEVFGVGIREIIGKIEALKDYRFSIAIENGKYKNYFTEKILDCFLTGTIPIYHGCPNIGDFFNTNGFFIFETVDDLLKIINSLTEKDYYYRIPIIKENFQKADQWWMDNDRLFEKYIKPVI